MAFLTIISLLSVAAYLLYKWATRDFDIFAQRGIPYAKPYPLVGNSVAVLGGRSSFHKEIMQICKKFKDQKVFGYFNMQQPAFVVTDPEYIKKICIKDFDYFPNHRPFVRAENEKMVTSMLSIMQDQRWKDMRNTLTPVFTASKMRTMFSLMNECFDESLKYLTKQQTLGKDGGFDLELKQCCTRLSNDIIASTAFGLKINSYEQQDNEFYSIGQSITNFRGKQMLKFFLAASFPKLMDRLGVRIFDTKKCNYFMRLVVDAMKYRKEHNVHRADMIQLLIEAKEESEHNWSDEELVAQCFVFFFAAFENNANLICTTCHELMLNPEVQERLYEEACDIHKELNGSALNYDMVNKMKYMDMVVSESLRKWSLAAMTDRVCSKDYKLYDDDGNFVVEFKKGDNIWIPIQGIHMNEDNYESPEVFDPERFSEENKKNINPFKYLPFGVGPRNCIGNRYALMQAKAMLYYLVLNYKFQRSAKTVPNLLDAMRGFQVNPANGFWLRFVPRK